MDKFQIDFSNKIIIYFIKNKQMSKEREDFYDDEYNYDEGEGEGEGDEFGEFIPEVKAFERAGKARPIEVREGSMIGGIQSLADDEKFRLGLIEFIKKYNDVLKLSEASQKFLGDLSLIFDKVRFKNPGATVLGYYILDKGDIDQKKISKIKDILSVNNINIEDIIRYARLVKRYLK